MQAHDNQLRQPLNRNRLNNSMQQTNVASQRLNNAIQQLRRSNETQRIFETSFISVDNAKDSSNQLFSRDIWVADTGASCHITNSGYRAISLEEETMLRHSIDA